MTLIRVTWFHLALKKLNEMITKKNQTIKSSFILFRNQYRYQRVSYKVIWICVLIVDKKIESLSND